MTMLGGCVGGIIASGAGGDFTPDQYSNLRLWLDASDDDTVWQDPARTTPAGNGDPLGAWDDKSAIGNHFTQAVASAKPTRYSNYVHFPGSLKTMPGTYNALSSPTAARTVYLVFSTYTTGLFYPVELCSSGGSDQGYALSMEYGVRQISSLRKFTATPAISTLLIFTASNKSNAYSSDINGWENGVALTPGTTAPGAQDTQNGVAYIGTRNGYSPFFNGTIWELLVYQTEHTAEQRAVVHEYLANKHSITLP